MLGTLRRSPAFSALLGALATTWLLAGSLRASEPALRVVNDDDGRPIAFEAVGLEKSFLNGLEDPTKFAERAERLFTVHVADGPETPDQPAILGAYALKGSTLRFTPRFPLRAGLRYRAVLHADRLKTEKAADGSVAAKKLVREFVIPASPGTKPAEVRQVFPSAAILPENQLKFYVHFSEPMSRGEAYSHVKLLKADGEPVDLPFLELGEELWDASGRRLTLLIDPGRIKRGVKPREDLGPALEAGRDYTFVISPGWRDAAGGTLGKGVQKRFRAGPPVSEPINPALWELRPPQSGSTAPLVVRLPAPLDSALLERTLSVNGPDEARVQGRIVIADQERRWEFHPERGWNSGAYQLVVDTVLEDLAGNRIGRPFEVDRFDEVDKAVQPELIRIPFVVSGPGTAPVRASSSKSP